MPQIYEKLRYIDSQFNTFDSQNAFCESFFSSQPSEISDFTAILQKHLGTTSIFNMKRKVPLDHSKEGLTKLKIPRRKSAGDFPDCSHLFSSLPV